MAESLNSDSHVMETGGGSDNDFGLEPLQLLMDQI